MSYDRSKDPRADKVLYDALAAPTPKAMLTPSERARRAFNWLSYSAVVKTKDGDEVVTVHALNDEDARYRVGLRIKGKIKLLTCDGEAY